MRLILVFALLSTACQTSLGPDRDDGGAGSIVVDAATADADETEAGALPDTGSADLGGVDATATDAGSTDASDAVATDALPVDAAVVSDAAPSRPIGGSPRILVVGGRANWIGEVAETLTGLLAGDPRFESFEVGGQPHTGALLDFAYNPADRDRLASLERWDYAVLGNDWTRPEVRFEGVRVLSDLARAAGARPLLLAVGDDPVAFRIANGVGAIVVPVVDAEGPSRTAQATAAALYSTFARRDAAETGFRPGNTLPRHWEAVTAASWDALREAEGTPQYDGAYQGVVRVGDHMPDSFRFIIAGTSSERGYRTAMRALLDREGIPHSDADLGRCNDFKRLDVECLERGAEHLEERAQLIYARGYDVGAAEIREVTGQQGVQPQIYDRHWDSDRNDGGAALARAGSRSQGVAVDAARLGLAWIPQHINFARLESERPGTPLLRDGVHATEAVQAGLAAMSFVSVTGRDPDLAGLAPEVAAAVRLGASTIRQLATLSQTGEHVPDDPETRPRLY